MLDERRLVEIRAILCSSRTEKNISDALGVVHSDFSASEAIE